MVSNLGYPIIFWKLDDRTSFLIKQSEQVFQRLEEDSSVDIGIFCNEDANLDKANKDRNIINKDYYVMEGYLDQLFLLLELQVF